MPSDGDSKPPVEPKPPNPPAPGKPPGGPKGPGRDVMLGVSAEEHIRELVDRAPPLSAEQHSRLAQILRPVFP